VQEPPIIIFSKFANQRVIELGIQKKKFNGMRLNLLKRIRKEKERR